MDYFTRSKDGCNWGDGFYLFSPLYILGLEMHFELITCNSFILLLIITHLLLVFEVWGHFFLSYRNSILFTYINSCVEVIIGYCSGFEEKGDCGGDQVMASGNQRTNYSEATVEIKIKTLDSQTYTLRVDKCVSIVCFFSVICSSYVLACCTCILS